MHGMGIRNLVFCRFNYRRKKMNKKIKILSEVKLKGKGTNLFNYQYIDESGEPISAVFQATKSALKGGIK